MRINTGTHERKQCDFNSYQSYRGHLFDHRLTCLSLGY